jgi:hypothetical protein
MSLPHFNFFKRRDVLPKMDLARCVELGLITQEEKLRLEASRTENILKDYLDKKKAKNK